MKKRHYESFHRLWALISPDSTHKEVLPLCTSREMARTELRLRKKKAGYKGYRAALLRYHIEELESLRDSTERASLEIRKMLTLATEGEPTAAQRSLRSLWDLDRWK